MDADIRLTVDDGRAANPAHFFTAGMRLLELLDDLSETATLEWVFTDLKLGSAVSGIAASEQHRHEGAVVTRSAVEGLSRIRSGQSAPSDWNPNAIKTAKNMVREVGEHAKLERHGSVVYLDQQLSEGLENATPWVREFYGSVRGTLTGFNVTRGNRGSIKPHGGGRVIHVKFPSGLAKKMRDGLLQFVEVEGLIRQNDEGQTYYVSAGDIRVVEEPKLSWAELRGYMPEITGNMSISEHLDAIHGQDALEGPHGKA